MPFSSNKGIRIYYETEGPPTGFAVILPSTSGGDMNIWRDAGYVRALRDEYRIVLVDHRGRGKSDRPKDLEAHRMEAYESDVLSVMDSLGIDKAAFWGYSDGGLVGFTLAARHPDRIVALIVSGNQGQWYPKEDILSLRETLRKKGMEAIIEQIEDSEGIRTPEPLRSNLLETDTEIFALNEEAWLKWCNYELVPAGFGVPTLIINGELKDQAHEGEKFATRLPNSRAITLPGLGHLGAYARSDLVLTTAKEFLRTTCHPL